MGTGTMGGAVVAAEKETGIIEFGNTMSWEMFLAAVVLGVILGIILSKKIK